MPFLDETGLARLAEHIKTFAGSGAPAKHAEQHRVGGDTLTWDGDTTGLELVDIENCGKYYLVSDKVPSMEDLRNGIYTTYIIQVPGTEHADETFASQYTLGDLQMMGYISNGAVHCIEAFFIPNDNFTFIEENGNFTGTFPKKGTYLVSYSDEDIVYWTTSITVPGCGLFGGGDDPITPEMIGAAPAKHADQHRVGGDTLTWDGDTTGLEFVENENCGIYYRVSDNAPSMEDLSKGICTTFINHYPNGEAADDIQTMQYILGELENSGQISNGVVFCWDAFFVPNDNITFEDANGNFTVTFPKRGTYLYYYSDEYLVSWTSSVTVPGYNLFGVGDDPIPFEINWKNLGDYPILTSPEEVDNFQDNGVAIYENWDNPYYFGNVFNSIEEGQFFLKCDVTEDSWARIVRQTAYMGIYGIAIRELYFEHSGATSWNEWRWIGREAYFDRVYQIYDSFRMQNGVDMSEIFIARIELGNLGNCTEKQISIPFNNPTVSDSYIQYIKSRIGIIDFEGFATNGTERICLPYKDDIEIYCKDSSVYVKTNGDYSAYTGYCRIKFGLLY